MIKRSDIKPGAEVYFSDSREVWRVESFDGFHINFTVAEVGTSNRKVGDPVPNIRFESLSGVPVVDFVHIREPTPTVSQVEELWQSV